MLLDRGELLAIGDTRKVLSRYQKLLYAPAGKADDVRAWILGNPPQARDAADAPVDAASAETDTQDWFDPGLPHGQGVSYPGSGARIEQPRVETPDGRRVNVLRAGGEYVYRYEAAFDRTLPGVRFGMMIKTVAGVELGGAASARYGEGMLATGLTRVAVRFSFRCLLAPGSYFLNAGLLGMLEAGEEFIAREVDVLMIRVQPDPLRLATGLVDFQVRPQVQADG